MDLIKIWHPRLCFSCKVNAFFSLSVRFTLICHLTRNSYEIWKACLIIRLRGDVPRNVPCTGKHLLRSGLPSLFLHSTIRWRMRTNLQKPQVNLLLVERTYATPRSWRNMLMTHFRLHLDSSRDCEYPGLQSRWPSFLNVHLYVRDQLILFSNPYFTILSRYMIHFGNDFAFRNGQSH